MFANFFIDRPIFAAVLSIVIVLAGGLAVVTLPVAQYPEIAPPTVEVSAYYPGANARVLAATVAAPIEQQVNGVEAMMYMSSQCTNDGAYTLTITFEHGANLNIAQVLVQNRVVLAQPILPDIVKRRGVTVKKKSQSVLMIVNLFSPERSRDSLYLSNYATIQLKDQLSRLNGVGDITYLGQRDYSMRVWIDPAKVAARGLSSSDIVAAIEQQNTQVAAGQVGQPPVASGQVFQFTTSTLGRLAQPEEFADMILKADDNGRLIRLRDVARIELGAQEYNQTCALDGKPSVALSIYQLPGSNALEVAGAVRTRMAELKERFPSGLDYAIVYDTTPFITESIREVFHTLRDAVILVAIVVLLFLQNWRSALIPLIAVPVAVIGTFAVMAALGFSLNNLTMFGLVLAIGIVVDDAIVVVEAVEHHIENGLDPRAATIKAMQQVSGPVIAVGLVLTAVFVPCAFISGITGQFYRQFALTIAVSTVISAFNSLTLSPALTALLLKKRTKGVYEALPGFMIVFLFGALGYLLARFMPDTIEPRVGRLSGATIGLLAGYFVHQPFNRLLGWSFGRFNDYFERTANAYTKLVGGLLRLSVIVLLLYGGLLYLTYVGFQKMPSGFIPNQDKGYLLVNVQLPDSASLERTQEVMKRIETLARAHAGVAHTVAVSGQSILLNATAANFGAVYVMLDEFHARHRADLHSDAIAASLQQTLKDEIDEGIVNVYGAPPVEGLGTAGGFKIVIEDPGDVGPDVLQTTINDIISTGSDAEHAKVRGLFTSYRAHTPWLYLDMNRLAAQYRGVSVAEIFNTLQVYLGSYYVNDFNRFGRTWQVNVQADPRFRRRITDLKQIKVRNQNEQMVPLAGFMNVREDLGPAMVLRYNMYPAAVVNGSPSPGVSSNEGLQIMESIVQPNLAPSMRFEWTELALLQLQTGHTAVLAFVLAVVLVFLVLAAQYESWALPLAVILVVPMCLLFAILGVAIAGLEINIFTQVGFIVLVGLASKNAILIVEFAKSRSEAGAGGREATLEACRLRLRPIIMTSLAFILGVVPLVLSTGAGAEMRRALGTAVFAGMIGVTFFGIFLTPVFYFVIHKLGNVQRSKIKGRNWLSIVPLPQGARTRLMRNADNQPGQ